MKNGLSPQQEYFLRSSSASLNYINELCSAIDSNGAIVH